MYATNRFYHRDKDKGENEESLLSPEIQFWRNFNLTLRIKIGRKLRQRGYFLPYYTMVVCGSGQNLGLIRCSGVTLASCSRSVFQPILPTRFGKVMLPTGGNLEEIVEHSELWVDSLQQLWANAFVRLVIYMTGSSTHESLSRMGWSVFG